MTLRARQDCNRATAARQTHYSSTKADRQPDIYTSLQNISIITMVLGDLLSNAVTAISEKTTELSLWLEETLPYYDVLREYKYLVITLSIAGIGIVKYLWRPRNIPPGPWGLPIIGSLRDLSNTTHFDYMKMKEKYGDIFSYYIGNK